MYHQGRTEENCKSKADITYGMIHIYTGYAQMAYCEDAYQRKKDCRLLINATHRHTEAIMEYSAHRPKFGSVGSSGRRCMRTPKNSFGGVKNVNTSPSLSPTTTY